MEASGGMVSLLFVPQILSLLHIGLRTFHGEGWINTPIQGSAADVATAAMIQISECKELKRLGWKLLLQVHDEVILEGPRESAAEAKALVVKHMENPFNHQNPLLVDLNVDANTALTWYEAK